MYSRGEYLSLPEDFLEDKAIIRIHNINDKEYIVSGLTSSNQSLIVRLVLEDGRQITKKVVF